MIRSEPGLTDDELREIDASFEEIEDRETAIKDMLFLAAGLEKEGLAELSAQLYRIVGKRAGPAAIDAIQRVRAIDRAELVALRAKQFAAFSATPRPPSSAKPERSVRICDLVAVSVRG